MPENNLLESTWSDNVANDPKHKPQSLDKPSTTVRKEWCRRPQEAHLAEGERYRRLSVQEIAIIQGFEHSWVDVDGVKENDRIAVLGNAVAPPVAFAIGSALKEMVPFQNNTLIEICSGIGGLSRGFEFLTPIAKIELWDVACKVLRTNKPRPPTCVVEGRAQDFDFSAHKGKVGLLCGGPPCQPWSQAGSQKGASDPRDVMGFTPEAIAACEPEVFLFENVPGLMTSKEHQPYLKALFSKMSTPRPGLRYGLAAIVLNAADYGVPQVRKRVFILGIKNHSNTFVRKVLDTIEASATHHDSNKPAIDKKPWVTLREAFKDILVTEPWRKWNVRASEGQEFIVDETDADDLPATGTVLSGVRKPEDVTYAAEPDSISLVWPGKNKTLVRNSGKWRFEKPSGMIRKKSLLLNEVLDCSTGCPDSGIAILGEYAEGLDALAPLLKGAGRMVYFDSPRISSLADSTEYGFVNSTWLSIVRDIACAAKRCMAYDAFFVLQTDEECSHYGRAVLDEIFGHNSHVTTFAWQKKYAPQNDKTKNTPTDAFDYIIVYSRCHKDNIPKVGLFVKPDDINDDGDWRGCFTDGHKGAKSGNERTKFHVCMPPYHWEMIDSSLPQGKHWFDKITGVLWYEKVEQSGDFWIKVKATDSAGNVSEKAIKFKIRERNSVRDKFDMPKRIWWLNKDDNDIQQGGPITISDEAPTGINGESFSLVLKASGGEVFQSKTSAPGSGRFWEFSLDTLVEAVATANASFGKKGTALPSRKAFHDRENTLVKRAVMNWLPWQEYGKSEDATRHLRALADKGVIDSNVTAIAKPEPLLYHLISLFAPNQGDTVISLGDPNASMSAVALKTGRYTVHITGGDADQLEIWEKTAKPRLRCVIAKQDSGGLNDSDIMAGFVQSESGSICVHRVSKMTLEFDSAGTIVRLLEDDNDESISDFYAGIVGCSKRQDDPHWHLGLNGQAAYVLNHEEILDHTLLSAISRHYSDGRSVYVVAERSDIEDGDPLPSNIQILHAPFDLTGRVTA